MGQLCTGSLGDPIVNISFNYPNGVAVPLGSSITSYNYVTTNCPVDGSYTITANTSQCFGDTWHSVLSDHTGVPNSLYMLINASNLPGDFYIDTVKNLCANSTYEFASWILNVLKSSSCGANPIKPNITFRIEKLDGTLIQSYNTNDIPSTISPTWLQYGFFFTTPLAVSDVVLRMRNNAPGGCGNDLALDDITFRRCGPLISPNIVGLNTISSSFCEGQIQTYNLVATVSTGFIGPEYQWQQSINGTPYVDIAGAVGTNITINFLPTNAVGIYKYRLAVSEQGTSGIAYCKILSDPISITINPKPIINITGNTTYCTAENIVLTADGTTNYLWNGPNGFTSTNAMAQVVNANISNTGSYVVAGQNSFGCQSTSSKIVTVLPKPIASVSFSDTTICKNIPISLSASGGVSYSWFPATDISNATFANPIVTPTQNILYNVEVTNTNGCKDTTSVQVNVVKLPLVDAGSDQVLFGNSLAQLNGSISGNYSNYYWTSSIPLSNPNILNPTAQILQDTKFYLTANGIRNCGVASDSILISVFVDIYIPNVFTPNGDGKNDTWNIPALKAFPNHTLKLYNRFGQIIFESKPNALDWNGKYKTELQPTGSYVYIIDLKNGSPIYKGTLLLIR